MENPILGYRGGKIIPFTVIRVFKIDDYGTTMFMQVVGIDDLYSDEFEQELDNKNLDWEEYYD